MSDFNRGLVLGLLLWCFFQDLLGREGYLAFVDYFWVDSALTAPLTLIFMYVTLMWRRKGSE